MNLSFPNPVGLAAGFDRDGKLLHALKLVGFGFIEVGTFNVDSTRDSIDHLRNKVLHLQHIEAPTVQKVLTGISLGSLRNKIDAHTVADYLLGIEAVWLCSDYIVINLSRPGSAMRSELNQAKVGELLDAIKQKHTQLRDRHNQQVPILVKVAIDYAAREILPKTLSMAYKLKFDGLLVAFENWPSINETVSAVKEVSKLTNQLPLIVVGGIKSAEDAQQILKAGAHLVQCHALLVEDGPTAINKIIRKLIVVEKHTLV